MKRWRVFLTRHAEEDANEIWRLIAEENPHAAEAFLDAIEEASNLLSATPEIGSPRYLSHPELQGLRFLPLRKFEWVSMELFVCSRCNYNAVLKHSKARRRTGDHAPLGGFGLNP